LQHKTVGVLVGGFRRAISDANRVIAMVAEGWHHDFLGVRKYAPVFFLQPDSPDAKRQIEFNLARCHARPATGTPVQIDHHCVALPALDTKAGRFL
jgi:hypothetical protein